MPADLTKVPDHWMIEFQATPDDVYKEHVAEHGTDEDLCEGLYFPFPLLGSHGFEPGYLTHAAALDAVRQHTRAVVASSPEVAALRAALAASEALRDRSIGAAALRAERDRLREALIAVRDDAYVIGEECDEHGGPIGTYEKCPTCSLALRIYDALNPTGDDHG